MRAQAARKRSRTLLIVAATEMSMNLALQTGGPGGTVSGSLDMYDSDYGSPVQATAPAASDTISYASFLQALGDKG